MKNSLFRHLPTAVEALLFTGENHKEAGQFLGWKDPQDGIAGSSIVVDQRRGVHAIPGEYIMRDMDGKLDTLAAGDFMHAFRQVAATEALPGVLLEDYIANPDLIWYGPHPCGTCGEPIIRASAEQGGVKLDAPHDHHYPNHIWELHECRTVLSAAQPPDGRQAPIPDCATEGVLRDFAQRQTADLHRAIVGSAASDDHHSGDQAVS